MIKAYEWKVDFISGRWRNSLAGVMQVFGPTRNNQGLFLHGVPWSLRALVSADIRCGI